MPSPRFAHEECLTGFATWSATIFPTPLAWGASFDPALVRDMAGTIGAGMHAVGIHQGLAPVLDVSCDARWGRTEETIGEDPYLVGMIGTAYVAGLQAAGVHATLKHFAGYSASRGGRNMAPVSMGSREFADVIMPPFEMAIRQGGARSVMPTYIAADGLGGELIVEPGEIGVGIGGSSECLPLRGSLTLTGPARTPGRGRVLDTPVTIADLPDASVA